MSNPNELIQLLVNDTDKNDKEIKEAKKKALLVLLGRDKDYQTMYLKLRTIVEGCIELIAREPNSTVKVKESLQKALDLTDQENKDKV